MSRLVDRAAMTVSGIPGTGDVVLNAAITGYRTFAASGVLNGDTVSYVIEDGTNWEFGYGTYTAVGTSLARSTVNGSSAAGAHVNFTNKATVFLSAFAADIDSGGAPLTLHELADVNVTEGIGIDNFALVWNNATSRWVSQAQFSRAYADLTGKPTLFSGAYSDLTGKPTLFDGAYASLTGKPTLVTALTGLSDVTVTEGSGINGYTLNWNNAAGKWEAVAPVNASSTIAGLTDVSVGTQVDKDVLAWKNADAKWEKLSLATVAYTNVYSDLTGKPALSAVATSGAYSDLSGTPTVPTTLAALTGDVSITEGAGIDTFLLYWNNAATKWEAKAFSYANISGAPSLATVATSGAYSDLSGLPTLITTLHGLSDVNVTEGAGIDGEFLKWNNATSKWVAATVSASPGGSTTQVQYNSSGAFAGAAGFVFDGTSVATLGVAGTSVGGVKLANATSGTIKLAPATGALGTSVLTLPAATDTFAVLGTDQTLTGVQTFTKGLVVPNLSSDYILKVSGVAGTGFFRDSTSIQMLVGFGGLTITSSAVTASNLSTPGIFKSDTVSSSYLIAINNGSGSYNQGIFWDSNKFSFPNNSLGIRTTAPQSAFDVSGGVSIGTYGGNNAAPSNGLIVSGNVGVGNTSPSCALDVSGAYRAVPVTVGTLPTAFDGARHFVTDSTVVASGNYGVAVVGGGSNHVPVYYDGGATWRIG